MMSRSVHGTPAKPGDERLSTSRWSGRRVLFPALALFSLLATGLAFAFAQPWPWLPLALTLQVSLLVLWWLGADNKPATGSLDTGDGGDPAHGRLLRALLSGSGVYMYFKDREHRYLAASQEVAELVGLDDWRKLPGLSDRDVFPGNVAEAHIAQDLDVMKTGRPMDEVVNRYDFPGRPVLWLASRKYPLRNPDGEVIGIYGLSRDVTREMEARQRLVERERELTTLVATIPGMVYHAAPDANWSVRFVSDYVETLTGWPTSAFGEGGMAFGDLVLPADRERVAIAVDQAVTAGHPYCIEYRLLHRDGRAIHVMEYGQALRDAQGVVTGLMGTVIDLSARRGAEARIMALLEAVPDPMVVSDNRYRIVMVNRQAEAVYGYSRDELLGAPVEKLIPPRLHRSYYEERKLIGLNPGQPSGARRGTALARDGRELPMEITYNLLREQDGWLVISTQRDISERLHMEARFRAVFDNTRDAFILVMQDLVRQDFRMVDGNPAIRDLFGVDREQDFLDHFERFSPPLQPDGRPSMDAARDHLQQAVAGEPQRFEWLHCRADGSEFPAQVTLLPVVVRGEHMVLGQVYDLSLHKRTEAELRRARELAEQASETKSAFLANMSHEIRTPLNAVLGMTHLALQTALSPQQRGYLEKTEAAARALLGVVNDILDFSKVEAGQLQLEDAPYRLDEVLSRVTTLAAAPARGKGVDFSVDVAPDVPMILRGDSLRLSQVLTNLVSNAVRFTEKGSIRLSVWLDATRLPGGALCFAVEDTGIGIGPEQQQRLFTSFYQGDASTTRRYGGTGLGLAICRHLVTLMNGDIDVESSPGKGSRFHFCIPVNLPRPGQGSQHGEFAALDTAKASGVSPLRQSMPGDRYLTLLRGKCVLLAEDNPVNRQLAVELLRRLELEVLTADNGAEALAVLEQTPVDLVLMDVQMPEMDGLEATRRIRADVRWRHLPVIAMTANAMEQDRQACLAAGMNDHLGKPIDIPRMQQLLLHWLLPGERGGEG